MFIEELDVRTELTSSFSLSFLSQCTFAQLLTHFGLISNTNEAFFISQKYNYPVLVLNRVLVTPSVPQHV